MTSTPASHLVEAGSRSNKTIVHTLQLSVDRAARIKVKRGEKVMRDIPYEIARTPFILLGKLLFYIRRKVVSSDTDYITSRALERLVFPSLSKLNVWHIRRRKGLKQSIRHTTSI